MSALDFPLRLGLIGYPLGHSLSPRLHNAALRALGMEGEYRLYAIAPEQLPREVAVLLDDMRAGALHGLNVTIPHKQAVIPWLDDLTAEARAIGAVNTIFVCEGRLLGDNTDAPGFWADLRRFLGAAGREPGGRALILGAGGAARAVAYALLTHGYAVTIAARRREQAVALRDALSAVGEALQARALSRLADDGQLSTLTLVVNATPVGMSPHMDASPWPEGLRFPARAAVYDLVYNPVETAFVRQARAANLPAVTGLGMLVEQAALAFERWTGRAAPRAVMLAAVRGR